MKHTKGPWFIETDTNTIRSGEQSADGFNPNSARIQLFGGAEGEANARLIAAAPEMLEALKKGLKSLQELQAATGYPTAFTQIEFEEAIKKAEGN